MRIFRLFLPLLFLFASIVASANNADLSDKQFLNKISIYNTINRQEKLFLHLSKPLYFTGEDLWFSAYLTDAKTYLLNNTERVVYVELIKPNGKRAIKQFFKLENGRASGNITLNETLMSGEYMLVAYTNWMRNSGSDFYFKEKVLIVNDSIIEASTADTNVIVDNTVAENSEALNGSNQSAAVASDVSLSFYPEGGTIISGVSTKVAFEVVDNDGTPIMVKGSIVDESGTFITALNSIWQGKGYFVFVPLLGKQYYALLTSDANHTQKFPLPQIQSSGYSLTVESTFQSDDVLVTINGAGESSKGRFFLLAMQEQKPLYALADTLKSEGKTFSINMSSFKTGIVQFTLFDQNKKPQCERLLFVNKNDQLNLSVKTNKSTFEKRDKIALELVATDKNGAPVSGTFSLAVTDASRLDDSYYQSNKFVNNLYFGTNIVGFNGDGLELLQSSRKGHMLSELVMLTNGWRRYSWNKVLQDTITMPRYLEEPGIYVRGRVYKKEGSDKLPPANTEVSMMFPKRFDVYSETIDDRGYFSFLVSDFYGSMDAVIQTRSLMKIKKEYLIDLQSNLISSALDFRSADKLKSTRAEQHIVYKSNSNLGDVLAKKETLEKSLVRALDNEFMLDTTDITLDQVDVVASKVKEAKADVIRRFGPPQQSIGRNQISDIVKEKTWYEGIIDVIEDAIPGLEVFSDYNGDSMFIRFVPKGKSNHRFFIYIDGTMIGASDDKGVLHSLLGLFDINDLLSLDPNVVESIDLIFPPKEKANIQADFESSAHMEAAFDNTNFESSTPEEKAAALNNLAGAIPTVYNSPPAILSIYTANGGGLGAGRPFKGILKVNITGYSRQKEFFLPSYDVNTEVKVSTDNRTTLYWNPLFTTDSLGVARVDFYNSDIGHKFRVDAVGISEGGVPGNILTSFGTEVPLVMEAEKEITPTSKTLNYSSEEVDVATLWKDGTKQPVSVLLARKSVAAFADVSVVSKQWGTTTDIDGLFYLDKSILSNEDTIVISYRGDEAIVTTVDALSSTNSIMLEPSLIAEQSKDGGSLYKKALKSIFKNKSSSTTYSDAIYREQIYWNTDLHKLLDVTLQLKTPSVRDVTISYGSMPIKGRLFKTEGFDNKSLFTPAVNSVFDIQIMDAFFQNQTFLSMVNFNDYDFSLVGSCKYQNREMYKISFDQKDGVVLSLAQGYVLVDKATNGIAYINWCRSLKGEKYLMADNYLRGGAPKKEFTLKSEENFSVYQLINDEWQFKSGYQTIQFTLDDKNYSYNRQCLVTSYLSKKPDVRFPYTLSDMEKRLLLIKTPNYEPSNWRSPWFLPTNNQIKVNIPFMHEVLFLSEPVK